jgi:hypothetical protein
MLALALIALCVPQKAAPPVVELQPAPEGEIQPQVRVDAEGLLHLLTFAPEVGAGEVRYRTSEDAGFVWAPPLRVGAGAAVDDTRRGARIALGRAGRPHVAWPGAPDGAAALLYTRLDGAGGAFETPRDVVTGPAAPDAACAIAADGSGRVWLLWSAPGATDEELSRSLWIARSNDDGATFEAARALVDEPVGACAADAPAIECDGDALYVLYRGAGERNEHGMRLLVSYDGGDTFEGRALDSWTSAKCPTGGSALHPGPLGMMGVWQRAGALSIAHFDGLEARAEQRKLRSLTLGGGPWTFRHRADVSHPALAVAGWGEALVVALCDTRQGRELRLDWSVYAEDGSWLGSAGEPLERVPDTSLVTGFAREDGTFVVIY